MGGKLTTTFYKAIQRDPPDLFDAYGPVEITSPRNSPEGSVVVKNDAHYLHVSMDPRERVIMARFGRLVDGLVPPGHVFTPRTVEAVTEIPSVVILWLATGNPYESDELGKFREDSVEAIAAAVKRLVDGLAKHAPQLLAGDPVAWNRAAEFWVTGGQRAN